MDKVTLRSDRSSDYTFNYKGEEVVLPAGKSIDVAGGISEVVLPTCLMKIIRGVIVIKEDKPEA